MTRHHVALFLFNFGLSIIFNILWMCKLPRAVTCLCGDSLALNKEASLHLKLYVVGSMALCLQVMSDGRNGVFHLMPCDCHLQGRSEKSLSNASWLKSRCWELGRWWVSFSMQKNQWLQSHNIDNLHYMLLRICRIHIGSVWKLFNFMFVQFSLTFCLIEYWIGSIFMPMPFFFFYIHIKR